MSDKPLSPEEAVASVVAKFGGCATLPEVVWIQRGEPVKLAPPDGCVLQRHNETSYVSVLAPQPPLSAYNDTIRSVQVQGRRETLEYRQVIATSYDREKNLFVIEYTLVRALFTVWEA